MSNIMLQYLRELEKNNNREWYNENKKYYKEANEHFLEVLEKLFFKLKEFDSDLPFLEVKDLTFKLVRDTRFSKDKSPYNPSFRAHISYKGKLPIPVGYYISIKPGNNTFIGAGLFADMFKDATDMIREYIYKNSDEFIKIIEDKEFSKNYVVGGNSLKNMPKKYEGSNIEYLKYKSWYLEKYIDDSLIENEDEFIEYIVSQFKIMKPFNDYLNKALKDFKMPERP